MVQFDRVLSSKRLFLIYSSALFVSHPSLHTVRSHHSVHVFVFALLLGFLLLLLLLSHK